MLAERYSALKMIALPEDVVKATTCSKEKIEIYESRQV